MTNTEEECVTLPTAPRIVPKGAGRDPRQAEVSGPAKVPQRGGDEVEGRRWVAPGPLEADCRSAWQGMRNLPK